MVEKFDEDQPRDEQGRWTDGGGDGGSTSYDDPGIRAWADKTIANHGPDNEPGVDHELWRDHGKPALQNVRENTVAGHRVWDGEVKDGTVAFRVVKEAEMVDAVSAGEWQSSGTFTVEWEGRTQVSTEDPRVLASLQSWRGYSHIVAFRVGGLTARSVYEPIDGLVRADHSVGLGIVDKIPMSNVISVRSLGNNRLGPDVTDATLRTGT